MTTARWARRNGRFGYWEDNGSEVAWVESATIYGCNDATMEQAIADAEAAVRDANILARARQMAIEIGDLGSVKAAYAEDIDALLNLLTEDKP